MVNLKFGGHGKSKPRRVEAATRSSFTSHDCATTISLSILLALPAAGVLALTKIEETAFLHGWYFLPTVRGLFPEVRLEDSLHSLHVCSSDSESLPCPRAVEGCLIIYTQTMDCG